MQRRADVTCGNHLSTADGRTATWLETPAPPPDYASELQRNNQCDISSSQPPPHCWPDRHLPAPPIPPNRPRAQPTTSCSCTALSSTRRAGAGRRYSHEKRLQRHAGGKSAHLAHSRRRRHQAGAREAGRQDGSRRPFMGRRGDHASRQRSQGLGAGLCFRLRARSRESLASLAKSGPPTEGGRRSIPTRRAISTSTPRCFLGRRGRPSAGDRRVIWPTRSFR